MRTGIGLSVSVSCPMSSNSAAEINDVSSDEPPYEMNGRVTPVKGNKRRFPPIIKIDWSTEYTVIPAARKRLN